MPPALVDPQPVTSPDLPPVPVLRPRVDPAREYIAVRPFQGGTALQALPRPVDDLTRDLDPALYQQMQHDPQVQGALNLLLMAVLTQGLQLVPGLDGQAADKDAPEYAQAERVATFSRRMLAALPTPLAVTLYELGQALAEGHKVAELVYGPVPALDGATKTAQIALTAIQPKPNDRIAFVADPVGHTLGVRYASISQPLVTGPIIVGADGSIPNFLPRTKVAIATWQPQNSDPRGSSHLRAAYNGWWFRQQVWPEYLAWLATMATPTVVGTLSERARDRTTDADGTPLAAPVSALDDLADALEAVKSRGYLALPYGYMATLLQQQNAGATGTPFRDALDYGAREIWMALTGQSRANLEAQHGSRADSGTAQDEKGLVIGWLKGWYEILIVTDLLAPAIIANYGAAARRYLPLASLGDTEQQDLASLLTALASVGYALHDSQFPAVDAMANMPPRNLEAVAADKEAAHAMQERIAQAPPAGPPNGPPAAGDSEKPTPDAPPAQGQAPPPPPPQKGAPSNG